MAKFSGDLLKDVAGRLRRGVSIRLVSSPGGGRTLFCQMLIEELEKTGAFVLHLRGHHLLTMQPLAGFKGVFPELWAATKSGARQSIDTLSLVDEIATELHSQPLVIFVIDDVNLLDRQTLAVIDLLRSRINLSLLTTISNRVSWPDPDTERMVLKWADTQEKISSLRFEEVTKLATDLLGAPVRYDLAIDIFTLSAGNPYYATTIIQSALQAGTIVKQGKTWSRVGPTLWNPHIDSMVELIFSGLTYEQKAGLLTLTILGPQTYDVFQKVVAPEVLAALESSGFLTSLGERGLNDTIPLISVTPPLLGEYVRKNQATLEYQRALGQLRELLPQVDEAVKQQIAASNLVDPGLSTPIESAALSDFLAKQARIRTDALWQNWVESSTLPNGVAYLESIWDTAFNAEKVEIVFAKCLPQISDYPEFAGHISIMYAEWQFSYKEDFSGAMETLAELGSRFPRLVDEAEAYAIILETTTIRLDPNSFAKLEAMLLRAGPTSLVPTALVLLYVVDLRPQEALRVIHSRNQEFKTTPLNALHNLVYILALQQSGDSAAALAESRHMRQVSRGTLAKLGLMCSAYATCNILVENGRWAEAEQSIGSALQIGKPGLVLTPIHAALLRLEALIAARTGKITLARSLLQAAEETPMRAGAFPAMTDNFSKIVEHMMTEPGPQQNGLAAEEYSKIADEATENGHTYSAFNALEASIILDVTKASVQGMEKITRERNYHTRDQLLELANAILDKQFGTLDDLIKNYSEIESTACATILLKSSAAKADAQGDHFVALQLKKSCEQLYQRYPGSRQSDGAMSGTAHQFLSSREHQIALLVDSLSNAEIAERLDISVRTVENHIHKSLKKTGLENRNELFAYVVDLI